MRVDEWVVAASQLELSNSLVVYFFAFQPKRPTVGLLKAQSQ